MTMIAMSVGRHGSNLLRDVRFVQQMLNRFRIPHARHLKVDGMAGGFTIQAIEAFQRRYVRMHHPDGIIAPNGRTIQLLAAHQPTLVKPDMNATAEAPAADTGGSAIVVRTDGTIAWGAKVSLDFKKKVIAICEELELAPDYLMSAMAFESGESFSPSVPNGAGSGAVGLIQFMPSTAKALGTTTEKLAAMTAEDQLDYVKTYFLPRKGKLHSLEDLYMAILYPKAIGQSVDFVLFDQGSKAYQQNSGLDANDDGSITVSEAASAVRKKYEKGIGPGYIG